MDRLLNKPEVCELLGISRPTLDRIVAAGELEAIKIRGQVRFERQALQRYLEDCRKPKPRGKAQAAPAARKEPGKPGRPKGSRKKIEEVYYPGMRVV